MNRIALAALALVAAAPFAQAVEPGTTQLRFRVIGVLPDDSSGHVTGIPDSGVGVDDAWVPELDVSVFVHEHLAFEVIAATSPHDISGEGSIDGLGKIADTMVLPPTVLLQYHFRPDDKFRPYLGAGINYSWFYDVDSTDDLDTALGGDTDIDLDDSFGWAAQFGFDIAINDHWFFNLDVKYIDMETTAHLTTDDGFDTERKVDVDVNPWVPGIGFGYRW